LNQSGAFVVFALAGAFSPGPNNTLAMLSGVHGGMRAVLPMPAVALAVRLLGAAYLIAALLAITAIAGVWSQLQEEW